jgi:crotonobetainyl-CoA:carnitine CoA-transferase CaiB-like acyl-CoA transferase
MQDLLEDRGLAGRDFWKEIEHPELGTSLPYPRQFMYSSNQDISTRFRAPLIGEHNNEIYKDIGLSGEDMVRLKEGGII